VEGYKSGKQLTGHSLGYLACLVKILFQLDILSRIGPRRGLEGMGRTSSISAVSSSIDAVLSKVANGNSITRNQLTLSKFSTFSTIVIRMTLATPASDSKGTCAHPRNPAAILQHPAIVASMMTREVWPHRLRPAPGQLKLLDSATVLDRQAGDGSNTYCSGDDDRQMATCIQIGPLAE
jgi:hypothetical protein